MVSQVRGPNGGRRPGAGRPKGSGKLSSPRFTRDMREEAAKKAHAVLSGDVSPLDIMLTRMRDPEAVSFEQFKAAEACAPYVHPRLQAIAVATKSDPTWLDVLANAMKLKGRSPALIDATAEIASAIQPPQRPAPETAAVPAHDVANNSKRQKVLSLRERAVRIGAADLVAECDAKLKELDG
jgi:hypothetical protein